MESTKITPDYVQSLTEPTANFLCKLSDNTYNVRFGAFRIRDMVSKLTLVDVRAENSTSRSPRRWIPQ